MRSWSSQQHRGPAVWEVITITIHQPYAVALSCAPSARVGDFWSSPGINIRLTSDRELPLKSLPFKSRPRRQDGFLVSLFSTSKQEATRQPSVQMVYQAQNPPWNDVTVSR
jgi:hypothetical protein